MCVQTRKPPYCFASGLYLRHEEGAMQGLKSVREGFGVRGSNNARGLQRGSSMVLRRRIHSADYRLQGSPNFSQHTSHICVGHKPSPGLDRFRSNHRCVEKNMKTCQGSKSRMSPRSTAIAMYLGPISTFVSKTCLSALDERIVWRNLVVALLTPAPERMARRVLRIPMRLGHNLVQERRTDGVFNNKYGVVGSKPAGDSSRTKPAWDGPVCGPAGEAVHACVRIFSHATSRFTWSMILGYTSHGPYQVFA